MNIVKLFIAGLIAVGVMAQIQIVEDDKFKQDLANIVDSMTDPALVYMIIEEEEIDTAVV